jgi:hypothetical protein
MCCNSLTKAIAVLAAVLGLLAFSAGAAEEKGILGIWKLSYEPGDGQTHEPVLTITKGKSGYKGEFVEGEKKLTAKDLRFKDGKLSFTIESEYNGEPASTEFEGKVTGDSIEGECSWKYQEMTGTFAFTGKRKETKTKR